MIKRKSAEAILYVIYPKAAKNTDSLEIPDHSHPKICAILKRNKDAFRVTLSQELLPEQAISHDIHTGDTAPVNINLYSLSDEKIREQEKQVLELLEKGLIRLSASAWGFPIIFVKKTNSKWRIYIDYRALNELTLKNSYPLPHIQDLLDRIGTAQYMSKLDLTSGYWQVRVGASSIVKTAFNTI